MKTWVTLLLLLAGSCLHSLAQTLKYSPEGKFKIVQLTDIHYIYQDSRSEISLQNIDEVIRTEQPQLIVLTGDVIYGKPAEESLRTVLDKLSEYRIPFAVTFGNHDDEQGLTRKELLQILRQYPMNLTASDETLPGVTNCVLPVAHSGNAQPATVLYCFDSHSYSQIEGIGGYDYIKSEQIQWYKTTSRKFTQENQGSPLPSLAFFHIPLPEYHTAIQDESTPVIGTRKEPACAPVLNSGLFTAMKEMNDITGVFVGHDHDNDYAAYWQRILLAYGRYSGGDTVYNNLPCGARVIELTENQPAFRTWIHQYDGSIQHAITVPDFFLKKKR